jgi:hypothetical protein
MIPFSRGEGGRVSREYTSSQSGTTEEQPTPLAGPNALANTDFSINFQSNNRKSTIDKSAQIAALRIGGQTGIIM